MSRFLVLDRQSHCPLYEAESLSQARGFCDAHAGPTAISALLETTDCHELTYRICAVDTESGQIVAVVAVVDVFDAPRAFTSLRLVLLPEATFYCQPEGGIE